MKSNVKRLFAGPYILWMIGFTIIPLLLIVYYGLTNTIKLPAPMPRRRSTNASG